LPATPQIFHATVVHRPQTEFSPSPASSVTILDPLT
jgi:hypothetical protein